MPWLFGFSYEGKFAATGLLFSNVAAQDAFFDSQGYAKGWKSGLVIPEEVVPKEVIMTKGKRLYDFISVQGAPLVSERFKTLVDNIEPGAHQFFPVSVIDAQTRSTLPDRRFVFNIATEIEAIIESQSNVHAEGRGQLKGWSYTMQPGPWRMSLDKQQIEKRACWTDKRYPRHWFASNALIAGVNDAEMEGISLLEQCVET